MDFVELALCFVLLVLKPLSGVVVFVNASLKDVFPRVDPRSVEEEEFMPSLVDKSFIGGSVITSTRGGVFI